MTEMTEREMLEAQKRADMIVGKVRDLVDLESRVLEAREAADGDATSPDANGSLKNLETRLETRVEELSGIADELKWATPCFRAYVLPQIGDIMGKQQSFDSEERRDLESVIAALTDEENAQSSEQLASEIITRLRDNLEKTFGG